MSEVKIFSLAEDCSLNQEIRDCVYVHIPCVSSHFCVIDSNVFADLKHTAVNEDGIFFGLVAQSNDNNFYICRTEASKVDNFNPYEKSFLRGIQKTPNLNNKKRPSVRKWR